MDYLKGNVTASAGALYVICRYLSKIGTACTTGELRSVLRPLQEHRSDDDQAKSTDALATSLKVGQGLGLLTEEGAGWAVDPPVALQFSDSIPDATAWFRGELLRRISAEAMASLENEEKPADLVLAMAWFMQQNPMKPLGAAFGGGAEAGIGSLAHKDGTLVKAVENQEQWRGFLRWSIALGLARNVEAPGTKVIVADASTAISDQFPVLPPSGRAEDWLGDLRTQLPILGSSALLGSLPEPRSGWDEIPPAVALGLLKLEKAGAMRMESADDGLGVVTVGIGGNARQVGIITVSGVAA
jgi:hypothetical protein